MTMALEWSSRRNQFILFTLVCTLILYVHLWNVPSLKEAAPKAEDVLVPVPEINDHEMHSIGIGKKIFFHESSNRLLQHRVIQLNGRQSCALESAARANPDSTVFLLYTIPAKFVFDTVYLNRSEFTHKCILRYQNIRVRKLNMVNYMRNTSLEQWYASGALNNSQYPIEHASDVLRYLTLWKYGGTYIDLDFVVLKKIEDIGINYVVAESEYGMSNSVLNFEGDKIGHDFAENCLTEVKTHYRGDAWSYNGPQLIFRVANKMCDTDKLELMFKNKTRCKGFNVYEPPLFFPIPFQNWTFFFDTTTTGYVMKTLNMSHGVHLWNKLSGSTLVDKKIDVAYGILAKQYCPYSYWGSKDVF